MIDPDPPTHVGAATPFDPNEYYREVAAKIRLLYEKAMANVVESKKRQAGAYNKGRHRHTYAVGDLVWRRNFPKSQKALNLMAKFCPKFVGPFRVKALMGENHLILETLKGVEVGKCECSHLKPAFVD